MRVLIVDDDKFLQTLIESELHQQNIEVDIANNGQEAIELMKKNKPTLVLLELVLERMNGFDLLAEMKKHKELKDVPVVIASVLSQKKDVEEVMSLGVVKYLPKDNFSQKQVIQEILNILMTL